MPLKKISKKLLVEKVEKFTKEKYTNTRKVIDFNERMKRIQELLYPRLDINSKRTDKFLDNLELHKKLKKNYERYDKLVKSLNKYKNISIESLKHQFKMFNLLSEQEIIIQKSILTKFKSKELNQLHEKLVRNLDYFLFRLNKEKKETLKSVDKKVDFKEFEYDFLVKYSNLLEAEKTTEDAIELTNYFLKIIKTEIKRNTVSIN